MLVKDKIPINAPLLTCEVGETVHRFLPCGKCGAVWNEKCKLAAQGKFTLAHAEERRDSS